MKLPNANAVFIDRRKITDYCLSSEHLRGKDKAHVFESALGLTADDTEILYQALFQAAQTGQAIVGRNDEYGQRYIIDFEMVHLSRNRIVRSAWIIRPDEDFPRFVSAYVR